MKKYVAIFFVLAVAGVSCSSNEGQQQTSGDISTGDSCTCSSDEECQSQAGECMVAVCHCTCQVVPSKKGTKCDDNNPKTANDTCDGEGHCIGEYVVCGDNKCTGDETCLSCPQDCGCPEGFACVGDGECQKLPKCPDGECEKGENCGTCPQDCGCESGKVCFKEGGECVNCQDYCKKAGKECGTDENGCDCGTCDNGKVCNALGKCEDSTLCGNGTCETSEDCGTCPQDCGCGKGESCIEHKCQNCQDVCKANNRECGSIFGCNCGGCPVCYHCSQGQCKGKQSCVCYNKECGQVGEFDCGTCDAGQDCVFHKCVAGCDELCKDKACGWSGTGDDACFCGFCDGCTQCDPNTNQCVAANEDKTNEPNDLPADATEITGTSGTMDTSLYPSEDDDWYKMELTSNSSILFTLSGLAPDKDYDLVVCLVCKEGETNGTSLLGEKDGVYKIDPLVDGAVCYASINLAGAAEELRVIPKCSPPGGTYYVGVLWGTDDTDCGSGYTLEWER